MHSEIEGRRSITSLRVGADLLLLDLQLTRVPLATSNALCRMARDAWRV
jgi:hypothetical protein